MKTAWVTLCLTVACGSADKGDTGANGTNGSNGADGKSSLVRVDDEPPGTNCEHGGKAIRTGIDTNGDGILEDSEVTATTYVCEEGPPVGPVIEGDYVVHNSYELALLADVTKIDGNLTMDTPYIDSVALPKLTEITGSLSIYGAANVYPPSTTSFSSLSFGGLTKVGTGLWIDNTNVTDLSGFAALTTLGGLLQLTNNPSLSSADLSKVAGALTDIDIEQDMVLPSLDVSTFDVSQLGALVVMRNPVLTTMTGLATWPGASYAKVEVFFNGLTSLDLHAFTSADTIDIRANSALATLDFTSLTGVWTSLKIYANDLKQCSLDAISAQLTTTPSTLYLVGNPGTCP